MEYVLGKTLYTGAHTRIVEARHRERGEPVVLKLAREDLPSARVLERLQHEQMILRAAQGPRVIRVLDWVPYGTGQALVMERWGDTSLDRVLAQAPLPVGGALRLGAALARALAGVHRLGIVHRDIKPQNVLVDFERRDIRLIDFGVAIFRRSSVEAAAFEDLAGTLDYMAPEQTGRMNRVIDSRADLYALGATLYQMLTGVLPFETNDVMELIHAHIARTPVQPHDRAPEQRIPETVSALVLKLMHKSPEQRYQTAEGAAFDLERAMLMWADTGTVAPFELAARDWQNRIRKSSRLYGREREQATLEDAFDQACTGKGVLALVAGPSGVGKSALVETLRGRVRARKGFFAAGKFDPLQRSTPYSALSWALRSIVRRRLADPSEQFARAKQAWQEAAGSNGRILVDLIPELVHALDEPGPLVEVGSMEAKNRFQWTVQRFVRAIATAEQPVVLFLDDLQSADPASLVLLQQIVTDPESKYILIIGAYRNDEVDADSPLHGLLDTAKGATVAVHVLTLAPLAKADVAAMIADMLEQSVDGLEDLAGIVKEKTEGSPFFVEQFLQALYEQKLLAHNADTGRWQWQREAIMGAGIMDNVATLLTRRLQELSTPLQATLQMASCIGHSFDLDLLAYLRGQSPELVRSLLEEAVREGLLVADGNEESNAYTFVHDRVRQAAYETRSVEERLQTHLEIGRQLRARYGASCTDAELFTMLYHLNRAAELITSTQEKLDLAAHYLRGGQRAKASTAYAEAVQFLKVGQALLHDDSIGRVSPLLFETNLLLAEATILAGEHEQGKRLFQLCLEKAKDHLQRARVVNVWLPLFLLTGQHAIGRELALEALAALGHRLPTTSDEQQAALGRWVEEFEPTFHQYIEESRPIPKSGDSVHNLVCNLLASLAHVATHVQPSLSPYCCMVLSQQTLLHGFTELSSLGFTGSSVMLAYIHGNVRLARKLVDTLHRSVGFLNAAKAGAYIGAALVYQYWAPLAHVKELYQKAIRAGTEEGDFQYSDLGKWMHCAVDFMAGANPSALAQQLRGITYRTEFVKEIHAQLSSSLAALSGALPPCELVPMAREASKSPYNAFTASSIANLVGIHLCKDAEVLQNAIATEPLWLASWGYPALLAFVFVFCVSVAHSPPAETEAERQLLKEKLAFHGSRLSLWAKSCPETFRHMLLLVDAGQAHQDGKHDEAERLYDEAIDDAKKHGFVNDEALGLRLAGEHYLARGKIRSARAYLAEAHESYLRWGAVGAAGTIRARYPEFFPAPALEEEASLASTALRIEDPSTTTGEGSLNSRLDAASLMRAARALSSELNPDHVVGRLMELMLKNAGAQRGALVLREGDALSIVARLSGADARIETGLCEPLSPSQEVATTVVQYVMRTGEPVVVADTKVEARFAEDPYLAAQSVRSLLALPLIHRGNLLGVLYLEHRDTPSAFTHAQVEPLSVLTSQAAISVENARLYADLRSANASLEAKVAERTAALDKALKELWSEMDLARKIQTVLLPSDPRISGYEMAASMRPAEQVGGDYYDVFRYGSQDWVLIGDVSGHGVPAGLCMMMIQAALRTAALTLERCTQSLLPSRLLSLVNEALESSLKQIGRGQYMTITALCIEGNLLRYAGLHQDLLLYRAANKKVECIETQGIWLGLMEGDTQEMLPDAELQLEPGDVLLLHTDGYTEAKVAGHMLGVEKLSQRFAELCRRGLPPGALITDLLDSLNPDDVKDDVTLVSLRRLEGLGTLEEEDKAVSPVLIGDHPSTRAVAP